MAPTASSPLMEAEGVTVRFGGLAALSDVGLSIAPQSVTGLIGPNGAGKTTLFNVLTGVVRPQRGTVTFKGRPLRGHRPHRLASLGISRTFQGLNLFGLMTVLDNVIVGADPLGRSRLPGMLTGLGGYERDERELADRAMALLEEFGIADVAHALPATLPYGLQKRVALARALAAEPELLLLDEPASGLSGADLADLAAVIRRCSRTMGVVLVEHHMDLVMDVCDHIVVLNFGRVICSGPPAAVQADPAVAEAYLGTPVQEDAGD
ncbi:ABC transporter ATP-binding protein [Thermobifida cellulosilytica]|uniref:Branched-chain amino acid ABC transporter ATPase n=1 Tax=Thermobifida cellulosilytica TB100 TaxID=665004 RepID=A0A147KFB1_THECS|nr:ABC transporter ATP-binding protein [Thermobifida cellulosilytica]KUP95984.1 branched-chain amino acid ABC transporter ATPase [Thermobifida cellulosilytica TB100]